MSRWVKIGSLCLEALASFLLLIYGTEALCLYPSALPNNNLKSELESQPDRKITKSVEWYSGAIDGHVYRRFLGSEDFYHGGGYWIQARNELRHGNRFTLNLRSVFYSGSVSEGYTQPTGNYHLFGFSGTYPKAVFGGTMKIRAIDIERQTVGSGLVIEEKEIAGVVVTWQNGPAKFSFIGDGTSTFKYDGDMRLWQLSLWNELVMIGGIYWFSDDEDDPFSLPTYYYIGSKINLSKNIKMLTEMGIRRDSPAQLVSIEYKKRIGTFDLNTRAQWRNYRSGFGYGFTRQIEHLYTSYDQYDKNFTNLANILTVDDNLEVIAANLDLSTKVNTDWQLHIINEGGRFLYRDHNANSYYFYRVASDHKLFDDGQEILTFFASNKVLTQSYLRPPFLYARKNKMNFRMFSHIGIEGRFRF